MGGGRKGLALPIRGFPASDGRRAVAPPPRYNLAFNPPHIAHVFCLALARAYC